jgi:hypothetical protein
MILPEAVRTYIAKFIEAPDFMRQVKADIFIVTFWDVAGAKGLTLEIQQYQGKWAVYVRAQDRVGHFGIPSYVAMMVRAKTFLRKLQGMLQRDYWYGPNDSNTVWTGYVHYKGSLYKGAIAHKTAKDVYHLLGIPRKDFNRLWIEVVDEPEVIEAALEHPETFLVLEDNLWVVPKIPPYPARVPPC